MLKSVDHKTPPIKWGKLIKEFNYLWCWKALITEFLLYWLPVDLCLITSDAEKRWSHIIIVIIVIVAIISLITSDAEKRWSHRADWLLSSKEVV